MKKSLLASLILAGVSACAAPSLRAQNNNTLFSGNGPSTSSGAFTIKGINVTTPKTPEYTTLAGDTNIKKYTLGTWVQVEVEFACSAPTAEIGFHYSILIGGKMLTGDQTLVDVPAGQSLFTTVFVSPRTLSTLLRGAPLTPNAITNIAVQIERPGVSQPIAIDLLHRGPAFYATLQQTPGFVLNKAQTPFSVLWYDRYEAIKDPPGGR